MLSLFDNKKTVCGIDEAGRGSLAGPVTAAAVILPKNYKNSLIRDSKKSLLSDIQNIIFSNLIISKSGINKDNLYGLIWKKDKDVSMNKLDTHLTNLKNQIIKDLDIIINFQSQDKTLKLLID